MTTKPTKNLLKDGVDAVLLETIPTALRIVAWGYVKYSGGTPTLISGHNVASLDDVAVGRTRVNLDVEFSSTDDFAVICSGSVGNGNLVTVAEDITTGRTTTSFGIYTYASGNADFTFNFMVLGNLA